MDRVSFRREPDDDQRNQAKDHLSRGQNGWIEMLSARFDQHVGQRDGQCPYHNRGTSPQCETTFGLHFVEKMTPTPTSPSNTPKTFVRVIGSAGSNWCAITSPKS